MWTVAASALAAPLYVSPSIGLEGPAPTFEWPADVPACKATLSIGPDGVIGAADGRRCDPALRPTLDRLIGLRVTGGGARAAVAEARLIPPIEGTTTTVEVRPRPVTPASWPVDWPGAMDTVAPGTRCVAELAWVADARPVELVLGECPPAMAKLVTKAALRTVWSAPDLAADQGFVTAVVFAWIEDPNQPLRRLLVVEGAAYPRTRVNPDFPQGMTGGASCTAAVHVEANGQPAIVRIAGCPPPWSSAARSAVQKWSYWPRVVDGRPLPDADVVLVTFALY